MLQVPNLDDQTFEGIMESVYAKLPHLHYEWTDYNAHDPGITILELLAWYKQFQQYHLNQLTPGSMRAFLKLLGIRQHGAAQARAAAVPCVNERRRFPQGMRVFSGNGERLELKDSTIMGDHEVKCVYLSRADGLHDVSSLLQRQTIPVEVREGEALLIGLQGEMRSDMIRLWFDLPEQYLVRRNPFDEDCAYTPHNLVASCLGPGGEKPLKILGDQTHMLATSGRIAFRREESWESISLQNGMPEAYWLKLSVREEGCEEPLVIKRVLASPFEIEQVQTLGEVHAFLLPSKRKNEIKLFSRLAVAGHVLVFARDEGGWLPVEGVKTTISEEDGCACGVVRLPSLKLAKDSLPNIRIVCMEMEYVQHAFCGSSGMPGMRAPIYGGGVPVTDTLLIMCREKLADGSERYRDWQYTDTLSAAGGKDRVFTYEKGSASILFGDNRNGAVPLKGERAVCILGLAKTKAENGALLSGDQLYFAELCRQPDDKELQGAHAELICVHAGQGEESIPEACQRLKEDMTVAYRAVTEEDYEALARRTPGLRVLTAKALPLYSKSSGAVGLTEATVSVVVVPYAECARPMPNARFLAAVQAQMDRHRQICMEVEAVAPMYVPLTIVAEAVIAGRPQQVEAQVARILEDYFRVERYMPNVGSPLLQESIVAEIGSAPGVLAVGSVNVSVKGSQYSKNRQGDIILQKHAIPYLDALELRLRES